MGEFGWATVRYSKDGCACASRASLPRLDLHPRIAVLKIAATSRFVKGALPMSREAKNVERVAYMDNSMD